jgi:dTDP-4-dehydrorhamnose reductase
MRTDSTDPPSRPLRWLVTGAGGQLGFDVIACLRRLRPADPLTAADRSQLDIRDPESVSRAVADADVVVNCAAWTDVDGAETSEVDAFEVNASAVATVAAACNTSGAKLVHLSTDYVFDGSAGAPYAEDSAPAPLNAYGRSKLAGERAVLDLQPDGLVVRSSWMYGARGPSFVHTMVDRARAGRSVAVVDDQRGQPTWSYLVAERVLRLVEHEAPGGIYHAACSGDTSWFGLATAVYELVGADTSLVASISSDLLGRRAVRPRYSVLADTSGPRLGLGPLPDWRDALARALPEIDVGSG